MVFEMGEFSEKVVVITGAASGIGRATALLFARQGAKVILADKGDASSVVREIEKVGGFGKAFICDVADENSVKSLIQSVESEFSSLDILFNNAGITRRASVVETTAEEWDWVVNVNLRGVFLMSKYAIPVMAKTGGAIINTGSGWGLVGGKDAASYCATKAAVVNLTRAMAIDHSHQGIRVNCVCPGDTDTGMLKEEGSQLGYEEKAFYEESANRPMGRVGKPEEIGEAVLYLASEKSSFITGTHLIVDGGGLAG